MMKIFARFRLFRLAFSYCRQVIYLSTTRKKLRELRELKKFSIFQNVNVEQVVDGLERDGVVFGLNLPKTLVEEIMNYAKNGTLYASRERDKGFSLDKYKEACSFLKKDILIAQYFNTLDECPSILRLKNDPVLNEIALRYLKSKPIFLGASLWWTFPAKVSEEERMKHAHFFHRDVDDFKFLKFFFYLTDVQEDGEHVVVKKSHRKSIVSGMSDLIKIKRWTDAEVQEAFLSNDIIEIQGEAGTGFAENTLCVHKGKTPFNSARLLLQFEFGYHDYGVQSDQVERSKLKRIV